MPPENVYLTSAQVRRRYGNRNDMWLYRILQNEPDFPRPIYIAGNRYWLQSDLEAYEASEARKIAPPARGPLAAKRVSA